MKTPSPLIDAVPAASLPLKIVVSESGQKAALKALVGQCVPILHNPERFTPVRRRELAERLARAIEVRGFMEEMDEVDSDDDLDSENDPFCWTEEGS